MRECRVPRAIDDNRGLWLPVRWAHALSAALRPPLLGVVFFAVLIVALMPIDEAVRRPLRAIGESLGGDIEREIRLIEQFGGITSLAVVGILILRLDPGKRARVWDLALAAGATGLISFLTKIAIGRTRPVLIGHDTVLGTTNAIATTKSPEPTYTWELWERGVSQLWSMPSSHTSAAFALAVFLATVYPRLRTLAYTFAVIVGLARIMHGAHWPTDVLAGALLGYWVSSVVVRGRLGQKSALRLLAPAGGSDPLPRG